MAGLLWTGPSQAAMQCAPTPQMMAALERTGEDVIWRGIAGSHLVLLMRHSVKRTWTFIATSPGSITCIVAHGTDADLIAPEPAPTPDRMGYS